MTALLQKFRAYSFVHVQKQMPPHMTHFESDFDAIVGGSYAQVCAPHARKTEDFQQYSLYVLKGGRVVNSISWYYEDQLELLLVQDAAKAEELVQEYILRRGT